MEIRGFEAYPALKRGVYADPTPPPLPWTKADQTPTLLEDLDAVFHLSDRARDEEGAPVPLGTIEQRGARTRFMAALIKAGQIGVTPGTLRGRPFTKSEAVDPYDPTARAMTHYDLIRNAPLTKSTMMSAMV